MGKMKEKNSRKRKIRLVFDESERREFLTGFRKRKAERRVKAKEKLEKDLKVMKHRIKLNQKNRMRQLYDNQRDVPEVRHLLEPTITYELPSQSVHITPLDINDIAGTLGFTMGINKSRKDLYDSGKTLECDAEDEDNDNGYLMTDNDMQNKIIETKKSIKKDRINDMKKSVAFKAQQKLKQKKDLKHSKLRRKMIKNEMRKSKTKSKVSKKKKKNSTKYKKKSQ